MNYWLIIGGCLSICAGILHLLIIVKGAKWYEFFGAGEKLVKLSEKGSWIPGFITFLIASVLISWGFYAFSGAGLVVKLPFLKPVLLVITGIYLVRGLAVVPIALFDRAKINWFVIWSSAVSFIFGMFYFFGVVSMK